jgi:hypothetical protein
LDEKGYQKTCQIMGKRWSPKGGGEITCRRRNRRPRAAAAADSGEEFLDGSSTIPRRSKER